MQGARQQLLARAAVAEEQHRGVGRRDLLDGAAETAHGITHADDALERHRASLLTQPPVLLLELANAKRAPHDDGQHARIDRLMIEICRPEPDRRTASSRASSSVMAMILVSGERLRICRSSSRLVRPRGLARADIEQHHVGLDAAHQGERLVGDFARSRQDRRRPPRARGARLGSFSRISSLRRCGAAAITAPLCRGTPLRPSGPGWRDQTTSYCS